MRGIPENRRRVGSVAPTVFGVSRITNIIVPEPLVPATPADDPPYVHVLEPIMEDQSSNTSHVVFPSGAKTPPKEADFAVPSSSSLSASNNTPLAKPLSPASVSPCPRECQHVAKAKFLPSSPAPSPQPAPSEPFSVNLAESALRGTARNTIFRMLRWILFAFDALNASRIGVREI